MRNIFTFDEFEMVLIKRCGKLYATISPIDQTSKYTKINIHADDINDLIKKINTQLNAPNTMHLKMELSIHGYI